MQSSFFQNENRHRLIEYDLYESCLKRQLFYTKWCWAVIASALSGQNERSYPDDRKKKGVEMIYQVTALVILAVFYGCYFLKMLMQQRKGIRTDQIGQGKVGFVKFVEVISILLNTTCFWAPVQNLRCRHRCIGSNCVRDIGGDDAGQLAGRGIQDG